jgi:hypothetical protein
MAKRWAVGNGNWNTAATWNDPGGGATVPSPGDTCHANGYTVTIDVDLTGTAYELRTTADGAPPAAGGVFTTTGTRSITANVEAGTTTCFDPASDCTLYGTSKGGASANAYGAYLNTGAQIHAGNSTGGSTNTGYGTYVLQGGIQNGNSAAGSASGAHGTYSIQGGVHNGNSVGGSTNGASGTRSAFGGIHYGNATGGTVSGSHGTLCNTSGMAFIATATGTTAGAFGVQSSASQGNCVIVKATSGSYATDIGAGTDTGLTNHPFVNVLAVYPTAAQVLNTIQFGNSGTDYTGTYVSPAVGDVQDGVTYGPASGYTGTFAAPAVGDVQTGVGYGAGGTEFTGTLALPTEAQVESGVGFGAGGTEFTGTFAGGVIIVEDD